MRELLFRGLTYDREWRYGYYSVIPNTKISTIRELDTLHYDVVNPETVGQYTGLTDKKGKKIFEGDIIKSEGGYLYDGSYTTEVVMKGGKFYGEGVVDIDSSEFKYCKVVGNRYDNPRLLKGGADNA